MALGLHIIAEFNDCSNHVIDDLKVTEEFLNEAALIAGATIVKSVFHKFAPQGISGVVVIEESHFAIHTWPEHNYAAVDLFTCSDKMHYEKSLEFLKEKFECKNLEFKIIERGINAIKPMHV
jgi:S-adenosylmethionine decarboxylase proenzyme